MLRQAMRPRKIELSHRIVGAFVFMVLNWLAMFVLNGFVILVPAYTHEQTTAKVDAMDLMAIKGADTKDLHVRCNYMYREETYHDCQATLFPMMRSDFIAKVAHGERSEMIDIKIYVDRESPGKAVIVWNSFPTAFIQLTIVALSFFILYLTVLKRSTKNAISDSIFF